MDTSPKQIIARLENYCGLRLAEAFAIPNLDREIKKGDLVLIDNAVPQAVAHVGCARIDRPLLAVQGDGIVAAVGQPELFVEPFL